MELMRILSRCELKAVATIAAMKSGLKGFSSAIVLPF